MSAPWSPRCARPRCRSACFTRPAPAKLARGLGYLAKNDPLDGDALAEIGPLLAPAPTPPPPEGVETLAALVGRRDQLAELIRREKQHRETTTAAVLLRDLAQSLAALAKRREKIERLIATHLQAHPALQEKAARLQQAPGVGLVGAVTLLAGLPELGAGSRARISSLAGLAPRDCDSGAWRGARHVHGGRPKARRILYLCALSAARHHPALKTFYTRLRTAGKAPKVALIATARKLLLLLHAALKNPNFVLA
jgi:transposase